MKALLTLIAIASLALPGCAGTGGSSSGPIGPDKVVYHLGEGLPQASNGLRNIRNHLEVNPKAQIVVVAHAQGVDYLMKGKKDANGNPYETIAFIWNDGSASSVFCCVSMIALSSMKPSTML